MTVPDNAWVFDTGPLRHFAMHGWLGVLRFLAGERPVYIPDSVERELSNAVDHVAAARAALDADWIHVHRSTSPDFGRAFAHYAERLVPEHWRSNRRAETLEATLMLGIGRPKEARRA